MIKNNEEHVEPGPGKERGSEGKFAPGNQFWRLRSKHGRDTILSSPEALWESACEYFQWCEDNPLMEVQYVGKDAKRVEVPKMRPFTKKGFCLFLGVNSEYFRGFKDRCSEEILEVVIRIEEIIYDQKFTGAAAGFFKENIISRELGLANKQEVAMNQDIIVEYVGEDYE